MFLVHEPFGSLKSRWAFLHGLSWIAGVTFYSFHRRDPFLAAQLEATKRDSLRSLQTDEQRRFERLGYSGSSGSGQVHDI